MTFASIISKNFQANSIRTLIAIIALGLLLFSGFLGVAKADLGEACDNNTGIERNTGECISFGQIANSASFCAYQKPNVGSSEIAEYIEGGGVWGIDMKIQDRLQCVNMAPIGTAFQPATEGCSERDFSFIDDNGLETCFTAEQEAIAAHSLRESGKFPAPLLEILKVSEEGGGPGIGPVNPPGGVANRFSCVWRDNGCVVNEETATCGTNYKPVEDLCTAQSRNSCVTHSSNGDFNCRLKELVTGGTEPPTSVSLGLAHVVYNLYNWALGIGSLLALAIIIYGGVLYSASAGNPSRIEEAKKWITSALFGLALLFSTVIILNVVNPRLTTLEDIQTTINPDTNVGFNIIGGGSSLDSEDATGSCSKGGSKAVGTPNYGGSDCGGSYSGGTRLGSVGNFGDPACERPPDEFVFRSMVRAEVRARLEQYLQGYGACAKNVNRLTNIMVDVVAQGESRLNPNAFAVCSASGRGAFGLFQMNPVNPINPNSRDDTPSDRGDVPWRRQVQAAILKLVQPGGERYWAQWPEGTIKLQPCTGNQELV